MKVKTTMLKPLAVGLLTLSAACSTAVFADDDSFTPPQYTAGESWQQYVQIWWQDLMDWWSQEQKEDQDAGGPVAAPEIDPASAIAALSLLAGGLAVMRGRRSQAKRS